MNMLYEGLKEKGALMLIPSSAVESMGMGGMLGAAALNQERLVGGDEDGEKVDEVRSRRPERIRHEHHRPGSDEPPSAVLIAVLGSVLAIVGWVRYFN